MTPENLIMLAAQSADLTMEQAAVELARLALVRGVQGDKVDIAAVLEGMARIKSAGGTVDALEVLRIFHEGDEP